jgi:plastocyanin
MSLIPYSPRVETWNAVGVFPSTSLGIVRVRYLDEKEAARDSLGAVRAGSRFVAFGIAWALAACGSAPPGQPSLGPAASTASVTITNGFAFEPAEVTIVRGGTVTWTNTGGTTHTVTSGTPDKPSNKFNHALDNGKTFTVTFDESGTFEYFCSIHQTMRGKVVVR